MPPTVGVVHLGQTNGNSLEGLLRELFHNLSVRHTGRRSSSVLRAPTTVICGNNPEHGGNVIASWYLHVGGLTLTYQFFLSSSL